MATLTLVSLKRKTNQAVSGNAMKTTRPLLILIMFATLLKLLGCTPKTIENQKTETSDSLPSDIQKMLEDFNNRPIYKELTTDILEKVSDEDLLQTIFDNLSEKLPTDYTKTYETVITFSKPKQAIYIIWLLEAEVNNGGFNQYYFNTSGQYAALTPEALKLVGADKFADLATKANQVYIAENKKITKDQDGTLEGFSKSYDNNPLNKFDDEFYELNKNDMLQKIQIEYIRKHLNEFVDK